MRVGIVGLPSSGKTSLFRALTRGTVAVDEFAGAGRPHVGVVTVPDGRVDVMAEEFKPKKVTYASVEFIDGAARIGGEPSRIKFGSDFFSDVRQVDALVQVVRGFEDPAGEAHTPVHDLQTMTDELALADLQWVETRISRIEKQLHGMKKGITTPATIEMALLERIRSHLEEGQPLKSMEFTSEEDRSIRGYDFLTLKPLVAVLNVPEEQIGAETETTVRFREHCRDAGIPEVELCAKIEMEIAELPDEEEAEFLQSIGIPEPARNVLIRKVYEALGVISFITCSDAEVRAWTIHRGAKAIDAAATIHSDLARGFIRAEVASFADIERAGGWEAAKRHGLTQLHGKDYVVQDGDVIYVRFKV